MILAGDIGGTSTELALFEKSGNGLKLVGDPGKFASGDYKNLASILEEYLHKANKGMPDIACFGVAGPVHGGRVETTNLPWELTEESLEDAIDVTSVKIVNDLQAMAYGMLFLGKDDFIEVHPGKESTGNVAVLAPGTGLGEGVLYWDGHHHRPMASEGGHAYFAPVDERSIELLTYLRSTLGGHVSYERVLSGDGIRAIYDFLKQSGDFGEEPSWLRQRFENGDPNATISEAGVEEEHGLPVATLDLFATILGAEAGNLALRFNATGGVEIGGGIAPKIVPALKRNDNFVRGFRDKGRFADWCAKIRVRVANNPRAPLIGAARLVLDSLEDADT